MAEATAQQRRTSYREVFSVQPFRVLFAAALAMTCGYTVQIMALSVLVFARTGSPLLSALTFGAGFLPQLLGSTTLGSIADRVRPKALLIFAFSTEAGAATLLALAELPAGAMIGIVAAVGLIIPLQDGAASRLLADMFAPAGEQQAAVDDRYVLARSTLSMSDSFAQLGGLAIGGAAVASIGAARALLCTAALFAAATLVITFRLRLEGHSAAQHGAAAQPSGPSLSASFAGNKRLLRNTWVRRLLLAEWLPPLFATAAESLLVPYALTSGIGKGQASLLLAAVPTGMLIGNAAVGRSCLPRTRERLSPWLVGLLGAPLAVFALQPPLPLAAGLLLAAGCGFSYHLGIARRFLIAVPEDLRGQAFSLSGSGLMTAQGIGPAIFGAVAQLSSSAVAITCAGLAVLCTVPLLRSCTRPDRSAG